MFALFLLSDLLFLCCGVWIFFLLISVKSYGEGLNGGEKVRRKRSQTDLGSKLVGE